MFTYINVPYLLKSIVTKQLSKILSRSLEPIRKHNSQTNKNDFKKTWRPINGFWGQNHLARVISLKGVKGRLTNSQVSMALSLNCWSDNTVYKRRHQRTEFPGPCNFIKRTVFYVATVTMVNNQTSLESGEVW